MAYCVAISTFLQGPGRCAVFKKGSPKKKARYVPEGLDARVRAMDRLESTPRLATPDVAKLVLDNELIVVQRVVEANQALEKKASGIAVLDLALISVLATVAVEHHSSSPWIAAAALIAFALSLLCAWRVSRIQSHNLPGPITYNLPPIANAPDNVAKIAQELTEAWDGYATDERNAGSLKASWLARAFWGMYLGVIAFAMVIVLGVLNTAGAGRPVAEKASVTNRASQHQSGQNPGSAIQTHP